MKKGIKYGFVAVLFFVLSCGHGMKAPEYMSYVQDKHNGLRKTAEVDGWEFIIQYRPYDYIMLLENHGNIAAYDIKKRKSDLAGTAWFSISLQRTDNTVSPLRHGISSLDQYNERLNYYLNEAENDISLLYGQDTLRPVSYLFENNYNLTPQETMLVGFYLPQSEKYPQKDMQLSYNDQVFKTGIIKALYQDKALKNIPNLVY